MFSQEYVFVLPAGQSLPVLCRVRQSRLDGFAGEADISGLKCIEYEPYEEESDDQPTPLPTFLSCFRARKNPNYAEHKYERVFILHELFSRDSILMCNVDTMGNGRALRVTLECLKQLQIRCPSVQIIPPDAPTTDANRDRSKAPPTARKGERARALTEDEVKKLPLSMKPFDVKIGEYYFLHTTACTAERLQPGCVASALLVKVTGLAASVDGGSMGVDYAGGGGGASASTGPDRHIVSPITLSERTAIDSARSSDTFILKIGNAIISRDQIDRLKPMPVGELSPSKYFVDDEICNAFIELLSNCSAAIHVFNTIDFNNLKRQGKRKRGELQCWKCTGLNWKRI